jgi:hypothetical protein
MVCVELLMITTVMFGGAFGEVDCPQGGVYVACAAAGCAQPIKREKQHTKKVVVVDISFMIHPCAWAHALAFAFLRRI